jgi:hypothetical protein
MKQNNPDAPQPVYPLPRGTCPAHIQTNCRSLHQLCHFGHQPTGYFTLLRQVRTGLRRTGWQQLAEPYERQIYMTIEQAEDLAKMLNQTIQTIRDRKERLA